MDKFVTKRARLDSKTSCSSATASDSAATNSITKPDNHKDNADVLHTRDISLSPEHSIVDDVNTINRMHSSDETKVVVESISASGDDDVSVVIITKTSKDIGRKFCPAWTTQYEWLLFDAERQKVFCRLCKEAVDHGLLKDADIAKSAFISTGFSDWRHALMRFAGHEKSQCHRLAVLKTSYVKGGCNVAAGLSTAKTEEMLMARSSLRRLITSIGYLARQGLAIRGKTDADSNYNQLLSLQASYSPDLQSWLSRSKYRSVSHHLFESTLVLLVVKIVKI